MRQTAATTKKLDYTGRAFQQDAIHAMRGNVVRALIETITNADDAYGHDTKGKIRVEIERKRGTSRIITRDRAKGMRKVEMDEAFGRAVEPLALKKESAFMAIWAEEQKISQHLDPWISRA